MNPPTPSRPRLLALALGMPLGSWVLLYGLRDHITPANAVLALVVVIVLVAAGGSRAAGVGAALSSAAWFDFFLTRPYLRFRISDGADLQAAVLLLIVGVVATETALWGRRQQGSSSVREGYLSGVVSAAGLVAEQAPRQVVLDYVA